MEGVDDQYVYFAQKLRELEEKQRQIPFHYKRKYEELIEKYNEEADAGATQLDHFIVLLNKENDEYRTNYADAVKEKRLREQENVKLKEECKKLKTENTGLQDAAFAQARQMRESAKYEKKYRHLKERSKKFRVIRNQLERVVESIHGLRDLEKSVQEVASSYDD